MLSLTVWLRREPRVKLIKAPTSSTVWRRRRKMTHLGRDAKDCDQTTAFNLKFLYWEVWVSHWKNGLQQPKLWTQRSPIWSGDMGRSQISLKPVQIGTTNQCFQSRTALTNRSWRCCQATAKFQPNANVNPNVCIWILPWTCVFYVWCHHSNQLQHIYFPPPGHNNLIASDVLRWRS